MNEREQIDAFANELDNLVNRFADEFELSTASAVGVMMVKIHALIEHSRKNTDTE